MRLLFKNKEFYKNISWSKGTDAQIRTVLFLSDLGVLDLEKDCGWKIGDKRRIFNYYNGLFAYEFALAHKGGYYDIYDNEVNYVITMTSCIKFNTLLASEKPLTEESYRDLYIRKFLNVDFYERFDPSIKPIFKQFFCYTCDIIGSMDETKEYLALPAHKEVDDYDEKSRYRGEDIPFLPNSMKIPSYNSEEYNRLFQFDYYKDKNNLLKYLEGTDVIYVDWWLRTLEVVNPISIATGCENHVLVRENGDILADSTYKLHGISPFACI